MDKKRFFGVAGESEIKKMLRLKNIAIVGLSKDPAKESHKVGLYLKQQEYKIVAINPVAETVLEQASYPSLLEIPAETAAGIELVLVFRPSEETLKILLQALKLRNAYGKLKGIWLQEGIKNKKTEQFAKKAGLLFVQDQCIMKAHQKLAGKNRLPKNKSI